MTAVYVKDSDMPLWERAVEYADEHRLKMSGLLLLALERYLDEQERLDREREGR
ncbi:hypothetical protein [Glycomyces arizonensis]|uniref:hypothetical protein n=1 Tax=Glycomyces arizonensis TaxID=256035 RepID=UPI0012EB3105|nr:hypothetical protein [Glycomyces arizonensis]